MRSFSILVSLILSEVNGVTHVLSCGDSGVNAAVLQWCAHVQAFACSIAVLYIIMPMFKFFKSVIYSLRGVNPALCGDHSLISV